jgi:hypothetical protein
MIELLPPRTRVNHSLRFIAIHLLRVVSLVSASARQPKHFTPLDARHGDDGWNIQDQTSAEPGGSYEIRQRH